MMVLERLRGLDSVDCVIHGAARGADTAGRNAAFTLGIPIEEYPARWDEYGRSAGPIRNQQMLKEGKPDLVLAFHHDLSASKGTAHMVSIAKNAGVPVEVIVGRK